ncbi:MAG: hypothetical protein AAF611_13635 [Bacteroidota bacterium]
MKKKDIKSLKLNKKIISNAKNAVTIKGGGTHYESICDCPTTVYTETITSHD